MGPLAGNLFVRLAAVLLAALVLFNVAMAVLLYAPLGQERSDLYRLPVAEQARAIVEILDPALPDQRSRILDAVNSRNLSVKIVDAPARGEPGLLAGPVERFISNYDAVFKDRDISVELRRPGILARLFGGEDRKWEPSRLYVSLSDGQYVLFEPAQAAVFDKFLARGLATMGVIGVLALIGLALAVRRTARPIAGLAAQARALADNLDTPDIKATGPREIQDLARAFNHMKGRISRLVAERTRLLAAIAHDLRTYLTRLRLRAEFIEDAEQKERALNDLAEMSGLVDDTLIFASADAAPPDRSGRCDLTGELKRFAAMRAETGDAISLAAPPDAIFAAISELSLQRILSNLTDNALRYGGSARISVVRTGGDVTVIVDDDGPGVPEAELARMTSPFERLESSRARASGGAGLGLAIVSALAAANGGKLALVNRDGGGFRAAVTLPVA